MFKSRTPRSNKSTVSLEFRNIQLGLVETMPKLSKHQLEALTTLMRKHYMKRFKRRSTPKYGNLDKGFSEDQLQAFFKVIKEDKFALLFKYQAMMGLRVSEANRLALNNLDLDKRELTLKTEKSHVIDSLRIPLPLFNETMSYIKLHLNEIEKAHGYLFYPEPSKTVKHNLFVNEHYVRNRFRHYVNLAGLDKIYDVTDEPEHRPIRRLHLLSTHSLRHYAIRKFSESTNGNVFLASKFARHSNPDITMTYIHTNKKQLFDEIDNAFSIDEVKNLKKKLIQ